MYPIRICISCWIVIFSIFNGWCANEKVFADSSYHTGILKQYELYMDESARAWLKKDYTRALDGFYAAMDLLSKNIPMPSENYAWNECSVLKTYALLLARLVEIDMYKHMGRTDLLASLVIQTHHWADTLQNQSTEWAALSCPNESTAAIRMKWLKRIRSAIQQADKLASAETQN